jgi:glycosyltransferase involved in cell wall biosynthesis
MVDKVVAKKKVSYFHSDYAKWNFYYKNDWKYLPKINHVVVITEVCKQSIIDYFPKIANKVSIIENIVSPHLIQKQAQDTIGEESFFRDNFVLITVGHVCHDKGFDFIIDAARILKRRGVDFKWVLIGTYEQGHVKQALKAGLDGSLFFYGVRPNPYPYIAKSKMLVHPSRFESQALVVSEARLLCKPIVVTRFSTVKDILVEGENASVCEMNAESLADKIEELIKNEELRDRYTAYHRSHLVDNSTEIDKLYSIFES